MSPSATRLLEFVKQANGVGSNGLKYQAGGKSNGAESNNNTFKSTYQTQASKRQLAGGNSCKSQARQPIMSAHLNSSTISANKPAHNNHHNNHHHHPYGQSPGRGPGREMDTFATSSATTTTTTLQSPSNKQPTRYRHFKPSLPAIASSGIRRARLKPLTIEEYETSFRKTGSDLELVERVFNGSIGCNALRAALWPYLFQLVNQRGRFVRKSCKNEPELQCWHYEEHEDNVKRWKELQKLYSTYQNQWRSILPEQEARFSSFRERKSLIERDVIRCDRLHPFYAEEPQNLATLTNLLMTYMMYDFDIGYVQGMSDLAGPILFMFQGDLVKAFWVFVEVMKLFRRNFELTQKTIHFQLNCLYELIKITDPIFAHYLNEHDSSNCFFTFRAIVCQLKRELMRDDEDDYSNVLFLWDTIWSVDRRFKLQEELKASSSKESSIESEPAQGGQPNGTTSSCDTTTPTTFYTPFDLNQSDSPRHNLTETEIFVQALCLSMIRRERDLIIANRLDGTDIHLHFIDPKLARDLNGFIEEAINIYFYMKTDLDLDKLTKPRRQTAPIKVPNSSSRNEVAGSPFGSPGSYDLLNDFYVINCVSGSS